MAVAESVVAAADMEVDATTISIAISRPRTRPTGPISISRPILPKVGVGGRRLEFSNQITLQVGNSLTVRCVLLTAKFTIPTSTTTIVLINSAIVNRSIYPPIADNRQE